MIIVILNAVTYQLSLSLSPHNFVVQFILRSGNKYSDNVVLFPQPDEGGREVFLLAVETPLTLVRIEPVVTHSRMFILPIGATTLTEGVMKFLIESRSHSNFILSLSIPIL